MRLAHAAPLHEAGGGVGQQRAAQRQQGGGRARQAQAQAPAPAVVAQPVVDQLGGQHAGGGGQLEEDVEGAARVEGRLRGRGDATIILLCVHLVGSQ